VGWPLKYRVSGPELTKIREISTELAGKLGRKPADERSQSHCG
jgi:hypothetical protein